MIRKSILAAAAFLTLALILVVVLVTKLRGKDGDHSDTEASSDSLRADTNDRCETKLCFALDGSESVSQNGFRLQKRFATDLVRSLRLEQRQLELAAVQYGLDNRPISPLTTNVDEFLGRLGNTTFTNSNSSFVRGGIVYCDSELTESERDPVGVMVVMGDGRSNFGGDPVASAELFRQEGGTVYAVGVGEDADDRLKDIVGGDSSKLLTLRSEADLGCVVQTFLERICVAES